MTLIDPTTAPSTVDTSAADHVALTAADVPALPGRDLSQSELKAWVNELKTHPELWEHHIDHSGNERHYASLYRDSHIDVWLLCWNMQDDTGWHDHDISQGAVAVVQGAVTEANPRMNGEPVKRVVESGRTFTFGSDHIHRMGGAVDESVSIHAYSPPLWRMGQYAIGRNGVMRRKSVSYADELRPMDDESVIEKYRELQAITEELADSGK